MANNNQSFTNLAPYCYTRFYQILLLNASVVMKEITIFIYIWHHSLTTLITSRKTLANLATERALQVISMQ